MEFLSKEIEVGKKIQITRQINEEEYLASQILDIISEKEIIISGPIKKNNLVFVHRDEVIKLYFTVENKGIYSFAAKVLSREQSPVYTLRVERVSKIIKIQKRKHYRLFSGLKVVKQHSISENGHMDIYKENCEARDISGGGMRIYCNYKHKLNDEVHCSFEIENLNIATKAIVKRVEEIDTFDYKYSIGVSFLDIEEWSRDEIIKYVFEQQRILRNKGLM